MKFMKTAFLKMKNLFYLLYLFRKGKKKSLCSFPLALGTALPSAGR